mgnify:CR=1 FL=1
MQPLIVPTICTLIFVSAGVVAWRSRLPITGLMICIGAIIGTFAMWIPSLFEWNWNPNEGMPFWLRATFIAGDISGLLLAFGVLRLSFHSVNKAKQAGTP